MLNIQKKSDTVIIVIHEIYGLNRHMQGFCELLSKQGFDVICPDLLERETPFDYSQEDAAYRHFMENVGFTGALYKIKDIVSDIKDAYQKIFILGFSAGATVAWLCSEESVSMELLVTTVRVLGIMQNWRHDALHCYFSH